MYEDCPSYRLYYAYDANGFLSGIRKIESGGLIEDFGVHCNIFGDVITIYAEGGNVRANYTYDSWGKILSVTDAYGNDITGTDDICTHNSIRYRGYVYDEETQLYYLQSRYYDPNTCRFINADTLLASTSDFTGYNLFAYCGCNPICRNDPSGHFWNELWGFTKTAVSEIGTALSVLTPVYAGCGSAALLDGPSPIGDFCALAGAAVLTVGAIGYGIYQAIQAPSISISIPKVEEKADVIPAPPSSSTVIYRHGGTNPGNLTPKEKDLSDNRGLSFSTIPKPGCAMTTIEALNKTGIVYAVQDGPTHVSVYPVAGTMSDWVNAGASSIWTQAVKSVVVKWGG